MNSAYHHIALEQLIRDWLTLTFVIGCNHYGRRSLHSRHRLNHRLSITSVPLIFTDQPLPRLLPRTGNLDLADRGNARVGRAPGIAAFIRTDVVRNYASVGWDVQSLWEQQVYVTDLELFTC